jgi:hypothetical protein
MTWKRKPRLNGRIYTMEVGGHIGTIYRARNGRDQQWRWDVVRCVSLFTDPKVGGPAKSFKDAKAQAEKVMGVVVCPDCFGSREIAGDMIILDNSRTIKRAATTCRTCKGTGKVIKQ